MFDKSDLNMLRIQRDVVVLESFAVTDIAALLKNTFPSIVEDFKSFIGRFNPNVPGVSFTSKQKELIAEVSKHKYLDLAPLTAFVPEGLDVDLLKYSEVLLAATEHASKVLSGSLTDYSVFLSQLISNVDQKFSTNSFEHVYKLLDNTRNSLNTRLGQCFKNGSSRTEVSYGDIVKRNNDWQYIFHNTDAISKLINSVDRKALNSKVEECAKLVSIIIDKIKRNEFENMSPQVIRNLADGAYAAASELEFYSAIYYKVLAFTTSVDRNTKDFHKRFDN